MTDHVPVRSSAMGDLDKQSEILVASLLESMDQMVMTGELAGGSEELVVLSLCAERLLHQMLVLQEASE